MEFSECAYSQCIDLKVPLPPYLFRLLNLTRRPRSPQNVLVMEYCFGLRAMILPIDWLTLLLDKR